MADLRGMNLLRNDPEMAARLIEAAEQGDMDAQFAAGLIYAEGRGVIPDPVQAYFWFTLATEQGDVDAEKLRSLVAPAGQGGSPGGRLAPPRDRGHTQTLNRISSGQAGSSSNVCPEIEFC